MISGTLKVFAFFISISLIFLDSTFAYVREPTEDRKNLKLKHDYKLTFKKPYYYNHTVPFFDTYGHTLLATDFIRLAPSVPKHSGSIWAQLSNPHKEWEVELSFKITGKFYVGGRGIAFWYTKDRAEQGPVFGNKDKWVGLVIMFETVDHIRKREHPVIMAHLNDGSTLYNNITDPGDVMLAGCYRLFHNTPSPVFARISYYNRTLKLAVDANDEGGTYLPCFEKKDIDLPTGYYFGVSAVAQGETP
ncbi:6765_t:CDS:2, partial [Funneliformis caledonium]